MFGYNFSTAISSTIEFGHVGIIQRLLENGVTVYKQEIELAKDTRNKTVIDLLDARLKPLLASQS
jgi:hypothetical protein